jgi:integrase/recombinase XerD
MQVVNEKGERLYFTEGQRNALLAAAAKAPREVRYFCSVLCYTGCRISEALALTAKSIDLSAKLIVIESLKKRKTGVHRQVPIPPELLDTLDMVHGIREIQKKGRAQLNDRLWTWSRMMTWRKMAALIRTAGIPDGPHASPKGLRHGFGVTAVGKGIALNIGAEMARSLAAYDHGYLCERRRGRRAEYRIEDVPERY